MEENILEQPTIEPELDSEDVYKSCEKSETENQEGSIYGKFKDAKTLLEAYNSLQGEFTRKSQKLAEFQKKIDENAVFLENEESLEDILKTQNDSDEYKKEIEEMLANNERLSSLPNKYRVVFEMIKESKAMLAKQLNSQEFYDKYITKNDEIKTKIIDEYLSKLNNISNAPRVFSGNSTSLHFSPNEKPKTVKEAGEIFSKMLK